MRKPYQLYGRAGSGSFAVQVALEEIGADYQSIRIGRDAKDIARFRAVNATGKVPALALPDGTVMIESAAMLIHLADAHPQSHLAPSPGTTAHAMFLQWMVFLSANAYEAALRMCYPARYSAQGEPDAPGIRGQGEIDFLAHLGLISERLNPYVLGDRYSVADVYLYMLATWYTGDMSALYARLPGLGAHAALIATRPTIAKVEADHVR